MEAKEDRLKTYDRIESFWFPQWWWLDALNPKNLLEFINGNIKNIVQNLRGLVVDEPIFGFIARAKSNSNKFFVVFRGTREAAEWFNNVRPVPKPFLPEANFGDLGEVRNGFNLIYSAQRDGIDLDKFFAKKISPNYSTIEQTIAQVFNKELNAESEIFVTGHSLGAGLATLAALHISKIAEKQNITPKSIQLYTFASPRVGDETFASHFDTDAIQSFRIINSEDLIQAVPFPTTQVVDDETFRTMSLAKQARFLAFKTFLNKITDGQSEKHYQHVGIPITFTEQTGTIAGNHNLTNTYREALDIKLDS
ncbi:lipase family protein [Candidatus Gracilibacteria bacterium]|nr:lipase family protein [Candidatus Gracilibacteria bacterium]